MFYVGLDIHTKQITICVLNSDGKVHQRCRVQRAETMLLVLRELPESFAVCDEASTGYGRFFELLQPLATRVIVAHPGLLRLIFRSKRWWPSGTIRIASRTASRSVRTSAGCPLRINRARRTAWVTSLAKARQRCGGG